MFAMAENYFDYELEDDVTDNGGISFMGETLGDFCEELNILPTTPMAEVNKTLISCGIKPITFCKKYEMVFDMPSCIDGIEFDDLEAAKADAIDTLIEWMVQTIAEYGEENIEEWNYLIYNFATYVCEWDDKHQAYEEVWCPSYKDLGEIGWVEKQMETKVIK